MPHRYTPPAAADTLANLIAQGYLPARSTDQLGIIWYHLIRHDDIIPLSYKDFIMAEILLDISTRTC